MLQKCCYPFLVLSIDPRCHFPGRGWQRVDVNIQLPIINTEPTKRCGLHSTATYYKLLTPSYCKWFHKRRYVLRSSKKTANTHCQDSFSLYQPQENDCTCTSSSFSLSSSVGICTISSPLSP